MPKMLTVDEEFEAIVAGDLREVRADKMRPLREPDPSKPSPEEEAPVETVPLEEKPAQEN
ncbi:hypothetical protein [Nocardiopsis sp. RV163]|uniref:hypothetical protein n=1 Tax=Nocardiopsis sp. RV163 TaxID=1661388 RepID=UPI00064B82C2|nr:hypothetical protein [Nocardiopsis sp. RV163]